MSENLTPRDRHVYLVQGEQLRAGVYLEEQRAFIGLGADGDLVYEDLVYEDEMLVREYSTTLMFKFVHPTSSWVRVEPGERVRGTCRPTRYVGPLPCHITLRVELVVEPAGEFRFVNDPLVKFLRDVDPEYAYAPAPRYDDDPS